MPVKTLSKPTKVSDNSDSKDNVSPSSASVKTYYRFYLTLRYGDSPVLRWMAKNFFVKMYRKVCDLFYFLSTFMHA